MISLLPAAERFVTRIAWLDSRHTFSFGEHDDPQRRGFRSLRVINDDRVAAGAGFPPHSHRDMEIISYVLEGALEHHDSMGNGSVIRPGEVQRMSAGTGVVHSERNARPDGATHFLQIWILPERRGLPPGYEQKAFTPAERQSRLRLVASRDGRERSVTVHQDVALYATLLGAGDRVVHELAKDRHAWVHVARGAIVLGDQPLSAGDGAAVSAQALELRGVEAAEVLVFDLA